LSSKTPPSLLGRSDNTSKKSKSLLDTLDSPQAGHHPIHGGFSLSRANNQWFILLVIITLAATVMFYLFQPFTTPKIVSPSTNSLPASFSSKDTATTHDSFALITGNSTFDATSAPQNNEGTEQDIQFIPVENTAAKIEDISEDQGDIQNAFSSLQKNSPKLEEPAKAKPVSNKPKTAKNKTVKLKKPPSKRTQPETSDKTIKADKSDVAVISALLGSYKEAETTKQVEDKAIKNKAEPTTAPNEEDVKKANIEKQMQTNGAMDISGLSSDPAAIELEKCSTKNFIQKPLCKRKVCSDYRGKSPLCPDDSKESTQKENSSTPQPSLKTEQSGDTNTELTDNIKQEAKTMATDKTKEKAKSVVNKQFNSIFGGK